MAGIENLEMKLVILDKSSSNSYIGLSMMVVMPPAAAARVIVEKSSSSVPEQTLTFASTNPGMITFLPKS